MSFFATVQSHYKESNIYVDNWLLDTTEEITREHEGPVNEFV